MWWSTSSGRIELQLTKKQAESVSHQGRCDNDVEFLCKKIPSVRRQLDKIDPTLLRQELKEYGTWSESELQDHDQNLFRLVWIAGGDIRDEQFEKERNRA